MNERPTTHTDAEISGSVDTVRIQLFRRLSQAPRRRRAPQLVAVAVAVAGLFGGGIAVGAAAYASTITTGMAITGLGATAPSTASVLTVNCYALGEQSPLISQPFAAATTPVAAQLLSTAQSNPSNVCLTQINQGTPLQQIDSVTKQLHNTGHNCGIIMIPGNVPFYYTWNTINGLPSDTGSFNPPAKPFPATCASVTLPTAALRNTYWVTCTTDQKQADVYQVAELGNAFADCRHHGATLWPHESATSILPINSATTWITQW